MRGEHLRVLSFIHTLLLCDGEAPILLTRDLVTFSHINGDWMSLHLCQGGIASDAVAEWGTWGHRCDFLMHIYLIFPNANDLPLNVWPPECVFHDTYPFQLLRRNCCLPMGSVVGNSIEWVDIYTSHELQISSLSCYDFFWTNYSQLWNLPKSHLEIPIYESHLPDFTLPENSPKCACNISSLNLYICLRLLNMYESQLSVPTTPPPRSLREQACPIG